MSLHPSLRISDKDKKQRSLLKRTDRLKKIIEKKQWNEGRSVFGLPKLITVRMKVKKDKVEKAATTEAAGTAAPAAAGVAVKPAAAKPAEKKIKAKE